MSWCYEVRCSNYHWVIDLYDRLNLPVIPAVIEALRKKVEDRIKEIKRGKTDQKKKTRIKMKVARAEDQEARKKWVKRQAVQHTYGIEVDEEDDDVDPSVIAAARRLLEGLKEMMGPSWSLAGEAVSVVQIRISEHLILLALLTPETKGNNKVSVMFYSK